MKKIYMVNYTTTVYVRAKDEDEAEDLAEGVVFGNAGRVGISNEQFGASVDEVNESEIDEDDIAITEL